MRTASSFLIPALLAVAPVGAQQPQAPTFDVRWTAWLGCWQQLEETVRDDSFDEGSIDPGDTHAVATRGVVVCVTPAANASGVTLSTIAEKQFALEETIVADGSTRTIDEPGCTGTQRAEWSANGRRVFARAELSCLDGGKRTVSGLSTMAPGPVWVDVQVVDAGGRESIRVRRYRRSPDQSYVSKRLSSEQLAHAARAAASQATSFTLDEVKEASAKLAPSALEAALIETQARFPLNAKRLVELDEAGVPDRVIDLMVAVSFPNKFVVEKRVTSPVPMPTGGSILGPEWVDLGYGMFPYYYAPFGYGAWGRYDYGYYGYGGRLYFLETQGGGGGGQPTPTEEGRVVNGLGYTRVRAREPQPVGNSGSGGTGGGSSSGGSSSGSGGVTSQGYSSGGGGDSGRTAVARPPD
jgi:uncharacterized membrane protein YgcG